MAREYRIVSADSHVLEPPHIWTTYLPKKFHDKAPRVVPDGEGGEAHPSTEPETTTAAVAPATGSTFNSRYTTNATSGTTNPGRIVAVLSDTTGKVLGTSPAFTVTNK